MAWNPHSHFLNDDTYLYPDESQKGVNILDNNKSPRGLNAHLNLRKLPVVHIGVCH